MDSVRELHRRWLCSRRRRRALSRALRRTTSERCNPLIPAGRVRLASDELLMLADELELAERVDPATMVQVDRFVCDGRDSPLLNEGLPLSVLMGWITELRFRVLTSGLTMPGAGTLPELNDAEQDR